MAVVASQSVPFTLLTWSWNWPSSWLPPCSRGRYRGSLSAEFLSGLSGDGVFWKLALGKSMKSWNGVESKGKYQLGAVKSWMTPAEVYKEEENESLCDLPYPWPSAPSLIKASPSPSSFDLTSQVITQPQLVSVLVLPHNLLPVVVPFPRYLLHCQTSLPMKIFLSTLYSSSQHFQAKNLNCWLISSAASLAWSFLGLNLHSLESREVW